MSKSFKESLPAELIHHVTAICGRAGETWIDGLEGIVLALEDLWSMKVHEPFAAGEFNYVAPAEMDNGEPAVLKLAPPYKTIEIFAEAAYLREHKGRGAVRFIAEDRERKAILMEHALPGKNLTECFDSDRPASVGPAIHVLHASLLPPPSDIADVILLDDWFDGLRRFESTGFPAEYAARALEVYERRSPAPDRRFYLHGDFHHGNIVSSDRAPFVVIDPKGVIGHIGYDIACFLNNFHRWQETHPDIDRRLGHAIEQFSSAFEIDTHELREWAFAQMVLGAWWSFDDMPQHYDHATVAKADIWNV
jgi:streptomycin 6-kinase